MISPEEADVLSTGTAVGVVEVLDKYAHRSKDATNTTRTSTYRKLTVPTKGADSEPAPTAERQEETPTLRIFTITDNEGNARVIDDDMEIEETDSLPWHAEVPNPQIEDLGCLGAGRDRDIVQR